MRGPRPLPLLLPLSFDLASRRMGTSVKVRSSFQARTYRSLCLACLRLCLHPCWKPARYANQCISKQTQQASQADLWPWLHSGCMSLAFGFTVFARDTEQRRDLCESLLLLGLLFCRLLKDAQRLLRVIRDQTVPQVRLRVPSRHFDVSHLGIDLHLRLDCHFNILCVLTDSSPKLPLKRALGSAIGMTAPLPWDLARAGCHRRASRAGHAAGS